MRRTNLRTGSAQHRRRKDSRSQEMDARGPVELQIRGTTISYDELLVVLENIIIDNVASVPTARNRNLALQAVC